MIKHTSSASGSRTAQARRSENRTSQPARQFWQLLICLLLFLSVYTGRGVIQTRFPELRARLLDTIMADLDLRAALTDLGGTLGEESSLFSGLGDFCTQVFAGKPETAAPVLAPLVPGPDILADELTFLSSGPDHTQSAVHYLGKTGAADLLPQINDLPPEPDPILSAEPELPDLPAAGAVILYSDYAGEELPRNCTMDHISFGTLEYTVPVMGAINSPYGYRTHPISGEHLFHTGVDIDGNTGDPIAAFADGVVEYVGKDDSYGLYFQLDHGNGVKSFYAHCDHLLVSKGQSVQKGEAVAAIGTTGTVTGPHLHLELKFQRVRVDPTYYLAFSDEA